MRNAVTFIFIYTLTATICLAQRVVFKHLTVDNGLSNNAVLAITRDASGFMWYGTRHGLNKYDTRGFKTYYAVSSDTTSLSSDYITCLLFDAHQRLWIGTRNGLNVYDPSLDRFEHVKLPGSPDISGDLNISSVYEDKKQNIWVWSSAGLSTATGGTRFFPVIVPSSVAGLDETDTRVIYQAQNGTYWLGSSAGLTRMNRKDGFSSFRTYRCSVTGALDADNDYVSTIAEDQNHHLWVGTVHGGINEFFPDENRFVRFPANQGNRGPVNNSIRVIVPDGKGNLWIGTQGGLDRLDPARQVFTAYSHEPEDQYSLSHNSIYAIYPDRTGIIWVGTYWGGINSFVADNNTFLAYGTLKYHSSISNNVVSAIMEDNQRNLWIGTEGGGLNYLERDIDRLELYHYDPQDSHSIGSDLIKFVFIDHEKRVWIGTHGGGLNLFDQSSHQFTRYFYNENDPVTRRMEYLCMLENNNGELWLGTSQGVRIFQMQGHTAKPETSPVQQLIGKRHVKAFLKDGAGRIWIATSDGLFVFDQRSQATQVISQRQGLPANDVNCLLLDRHDRIWIGCYYGGFGYYDTRTNHCQFFSVKDGLPDNNVSAMLEDQLGRLWISTGNGLARYAIGTSTFHNYDKSDGLSAITFNINACCKTSYWEMLFGGYNGLVSFYPLEIKDNVTPPPIVFTALRVAGKLVSPGTPGSVLTNNIQLTNKIVLPFRKNLFSLDFASLNYFKSEKNKYKYQLLGFDKTWIFTAVPSVTYTNLPSGTYTFKASGTNNDGVWGNTISLSITVLPPLWLTWQAWLLYSIFFAALVILLVRYFILRGLLKKDRELSRLKLNFFTNISHEIRTHLSLIYGPVERLIMDGDKNESYKQPLFVIKKNADSLLQLVNELLDFRKAETGNLDLTMEETNIVTLVHSVFTSFSEAFGSRHIQATFSSSSGEIPVYCDPEQMEKVFYNILYNAYKFNHTHGKIKVSITEAGREVVIKIEDNGKGIATENLDKLFDNYFQEYDHGKQNTGYGIGLALAKSILSLHKASIDVESTQLEQGCWTSFTIKLKKGAPEQPLSETAALKLEKSKAGLRSTILLIEDHTEVRNFLAESLLQHYRILTAANGEDGLVIAFDQLPDIIISDVMMPGMDGLQLCNQIKTDLRTNHIPVILLTAKTSTQNHILGLKQGADIYLTKPFSIEVLSLQVANLLRAGEVLRQAYEAGLRSPLPTSELFIQEPLNGAAGQIFLNNCIAFIEKELDNPLLGVNTLARQMTMSAPVLYKKLYKLTGLSVNEFIKSIRMKSAVKLIRQKELNVSEIAYSVGYSDPKYFSREFKKYYGKTPSRYLL